MCFLRISNSRTVCNIDRLARSLSDLLALVKELTHRGVAVEFVKENLQFTGDDSPMSKLMLAVIGGTAEFERDMIRERQREGIAAAKKAGRHLGRVAILKPTQRPATPAFFDALHPPDGQLAQASPEWTGLPNMLIALNDDDLMAAAKIAEVPVRWGDQDPGHPPGVAYPRVVDAQTNQRVDLYYRPQDEYLEWSVQRDGEGVITAIDFTCEGPEYWETLGNLDPDLTLMLYREISQDKSIQKKDLVFDRAVNFVDSDGRIARQYDAQQYNGWNQWNMKYSIHLTHDSNSLGAEVNLGRDASYLWGSDD